jgi:hypothetical protein
MATLIEKVKSNNWFASGFGLVLLSLGSIDQYYSPTDHVSSLFVSLILGFMMIIFTV